MICYEDKTFCASPNCTCGRKLTDEIIKAAEKWWGGPNAPISVSYFCGGAPENEANSTPA